MKKYLLIMLALISTGCKKSDDPEDRPVIPSCSYLTPTFYSGAVVQGVCLPGHAVCQAKYQDITITGNPSRDRVTVVLCMRTDCSISVPSTYCSALAPGDHTTPCKTVAPSSVYVTWRTNLVQLVNAFEAGYDNYLVEVEICPS